MAHWTITSLKLDEEFTKTGLEIQKSFLPRQNEHSLLSVLFTDCVKFKFTDPQR